MRRLKPHLARVVNGRRGAFQLMYSLMFGITAITYLALPISDGRMDSLAWILTIAPPWLLGLPWLVGAGVAFAGSRQPRPRDTFSFKLMAAVLVVFGFLYFIGGIANQNAATWLSSLLYWILAGAVIIVSGMQGDSDRDVREVRLVRGKES